MNQLLLNWIIDHKYKTISPPRSNAKDFEIRSVEKHNGVVKIRFEGRRYDALPLTFEMFDRALAIIKEKNGQWVPLGTSLNNPQPDTIEGEIWKKPYPIDYRSPYKTASHICDFFVLSGIAEYGKSPNPTGRMVQTIRLLSIDYSTLVKEKKPTREERGSDQELFLREYRQTILDWVKANKSLLVDSRKNYSWDEKESRACLAERDEVSRTIVLSRINNSGGVDLEILDQIMKWGGFGKFPLRDQKKVLDITQKVFSLVDEGRITEATEQLLKIKGVGIARASKIIGLFDQHRFCIYDSRVGQALNSVKYNGRPILKCPPGRGRPGDVCTDAGWADNYQMLLWTLEVIRNYLNTEGYPFSIADVEMSLFMIGK